MRIAFVGLGNMGRPMSETLIKGGYDLTVHNRSRAAVDALVAQGAAAATSAVEAARNCDVFMTCLLHPDQLHALYFGADEVLSEVKPCRYFIDFATVEPSSAARSATLSRHAAGIFSMRRSAVDRRRPPPAR